MNHRRRFLATALTPLMAPLASALAGLVRPRHGTKVVAIFDPLRGVRHFPGDPPARPDLLGAFNPHSTWRRGPSGEYVGPMSWQAAYDGLRRLRTATRAAHPGGGFLVFDEISGLRLTLEQYRSVLRARGADVT